MNSILFNFLKYFHFAWSSGRAGVSPLTVLRGFGQFTSLGFKLLGYQTWEQVVKAALALQELSAFGKLQDGTSISLEGNLGRCELSLTTLPRQE